MAKCLRNDVPGVHEVVTSHIGPAMNIEVPGERGMDVLQVCAECGAPLLWTSSSFTGVDPRIRGSQGLLWKAQHEYNFRQPS